MGGWAPFREPCRMIRMHDTTRAILDRCLDLGFALAGIAPAEPTRRAAELNQWLDAHRHGEMTYLDQNRALLLDPTRLVEGAKSIICVADRYHDGSADVGSVGGSRPRGRIARYARGADYHRVMKQRLHQLCDELASEHPDETFRACVDTAPLLEREYAERAGLGSIGKHTLLIERGVGSYLLLGEIVTTLELEPSTPAAPDPCGSCRRCIDACPTDAISLWSVDATKCISYLTIEHRSPIDEVFHELMEDWIFGCDICQDVCPHNQPTERTGDAPVHEAYAPRRTGFDLLEVLGWTEADRRAAFTGSAMKRAKLSMMKRNALIVAGNALMEGDHPALRARIEAIARDDDEDPMVRETARSVLGD
jgi:epoxyqueuosine reductase